MMSEDRKGTTLTRCGPDSIMPVSTMTCVCLLPVRTELFSAQVYARAEIDAKDFVPYFKEQFKINVISEGPEELVFEMIGIDAPLANAFRRIMLSEIPCGAIETVYISQNTSIVQDEVLSHRLGLIPLRIDTKDLKPPATPGTGELVNLRRRTSANVHCLSLPPPPLQARRPLPRPQRRARRRCTTRQCTR
jgi:hypothetical protein